MRPGEGGKEARGFRIEGSAEMRRARRGKRRGFTTYLTIVFTFFIIYNKIMDNNEVLKRLDRIAIGIETISAVMEKPESKAKKALELAGYGITILGAVSIADIIRNWVIEG